MVICTVTGIAVSTIKDKRLAGYKLLVCQEVAPGRSPTGGKMLLAVDATGAGEGDVVAVVTGSPAMHVVDGVPVDAAVVAILDEVRADGLDLKGRPGAGR